MPADADRCFVTVPPRLGAQNLALGPLLSQVEGLPWSLALPVSAYARAELAPPSADRRLVREYVRFSNGGRARIRKELDRVLEPRIMWDAKNLACESETTCVSVVAEFVDDRTVLLSTGEWPYGSVPVHETCASLLSAQPGALEVSVRRNDFAAGVTAQRGRRASRA